MNKFGIFACEEIKENDYNGFCIILGCLSDPSLVLSFPIPKESAKLLNYIIEDKHAVDGNAEVLSIYKTMIDTWTASDRFLSGVLFDVTYNEEAKEEALMIKLVISDVSGHVDAVVPCNFLHAILLSAMEGIEIIISDKLLYKMLPSDEEECPHHKDTKTQHFPEDKKIMSIAKKIMGGKIKDN